jgi:hypothetical protein
MPVHSRALPAGFVAPCLPSSAPQAPSGEEWLHEIKHDGFRVIARKSGERVRLYSRPGNDLTTPLSTPFRWLETPTSQLAHSSAFKARNSRFASLNASNPLLQTMMSDSGAIRG